MRERGGGAVHVCMAHSLIELMMGFLFMCACVHFLGLKRVTSCNSLVSC